MAENEVTQIKSIDEIEAEAVLELTKLIKDDPAIMKLNIPDEIIFLLIRARRNRPHFALKLLKSLLTFQIQYPELYDDLTPKAIESVLDKRMIGLVKRHNEQGPAVIVFRTANWPAYTTSFDELIKAGFLYSIHICRNAVDIQRNGIVLVLDMGGFGFSHARQITYSSVTKLANCIIFGAPCKIIGCVVINCPYIFEKVWAVVQYAIPEYYRKFITVTRKEFKKLHELIDPNLLPLSLGGNISEEQGWNEDLEARIWASTDGEELLAYLKEHEKLEKPNGNI